MIRSTDSRRDERGQALVELALILPILLMLLLGIFEFGACLEHQASDYRRRP